MRNTIKLLMCAVLAFAFAGCTPNETPNESKLSTPNFLLRTEGNSIIVTWDQVTGAAYYEITLNPGSMAKTDKLIHKFDNLEYNTEYAVSVRAISTDSSKNSGAETKRSALPSVLLHSIVSSILCTVPLHQLFQTMAVGLLVVTTTAVTFLT